MAERMTVSELRDVLAQFPDDLEVIMRTYHKADVCPIQDVAVVTLGAATDITRVELRARKWKRGS